MIQESHEWKLALKRNNAYIRRMLSKAFEEDQDFILDRMQIRLVSNALFIRKLLETPNVASELKNETIPIVAYPWSGSNVDYMNCHLFIEKYQFNNPVSTEIECTVLCNQIIHSFVWAWVANESEQSVIGFLVSSDKKRHSRIIDVSIQDFVEFAQKVASSFPSFLSGKREKTGQWKFRSK